jgi:hypothetical protein
MGAGKKRNPIIGIGRSGGRGRTLVMMPTMVPTKTASRCQGLSGDTSRGRDQPDQEAREDGVPEGLQLRALPFGSRSSLHRRDSGRCARADDALGERALRHGGRLLTLTKRKGRGTFTLEELRRARSRRVGAQARGGNGARPGGRCFRISGRDARCDGRRSHMSHHGGHLGGREREYSVGQACREEVDA